MIKIVAVGKIKEKYFNDGIQEYVKRLGPYTKIEIMEVPDGACAPNASIAEQEIVKQKEGEAILSRIKDDEVVICLDLHGKNFSSEEISQKLDEISTYQSSKVTFVIAGSMGYSEQVIQRANVRWCLSNCTFPHQMVRLLLVEQIYRSYKIRKNENYHK
ncbi:23S rRNA (pseudouridine(1915)-N(3))-methyltransferase RlmH [Anaerorhabdus sp.]|uniref:23S rRNA (pseudouridine(1915)-N(3))-methyltransferase RlmH n=1 Tax=Anaerorhabdus sp. TaxID=1872524 RepID=UPI002FCBBF1D